MRIPSSEIMFWKRDLFSYFIHIYASTYEKSSFPKYDLRTWHCYCKSILFWNGAYRVLGKSYACVHTRYRPISRYIHSIHTLMSLCMQIYTDLFPPNLSYMCTHHLRGQRQSLMTRNPTYLQVRERKRKRT